MNHLMESDVNHRLDELSERLATMGRSLASAHAEIAQLQRSSRQSLRVRCAVVAAGVAAVFVTVMLDRTAVTYAQGAGQTVSAPFVVMSSTGKPLFKVNDYDEQNQGCLYGPNGKPSSCLITTEYGGAFMSYTNDMKQRTSLGVAGDGNGGMIIWNASNQPVADILVGRKGGRGLAVYDDGGNQKILVSTNSQGAAQVVLESDNTTPAVALMDTKANAAGFRGAFVYDDSNHELAEVMANSDGIGAVRALQSEGGGSAVLFAEQGIGGVLRVRGQKGQVVGEVTENGFNYFGLGGNPTAISRLAEADGRGVVGVNSPGGTPLAFLTESDKHGGGNITITDPSGSGVYSAGYVGDGANACIDLPKHGLKCEGVGLPMTFAVQK